MKVYGLSGRSGTGKSFRAAELCREMGIEGIVDDGLFIFGSSIRAGHSAKRDSNKVTAVKTAIFEEAEDRKAVAEAIKEIAPESLLVIGTSDRMVSRICERLELPEPESMIHIEDISDEESIQEALEQRRKDGKHIIPVPTVEIKKQFSGYFMVPIRKLIEMYPSADDVEKTVVRPTYSYLGKFTISRGVVVDIMKYVCRRTEGVYEVLKCGSSEGSDGMELSVMVIFVYGFNVMETAGKLQKDIAEAVSQMTEFYIKSVDIAVRGLYMPDEEGNDAV